MRSLQISVSLKPALVKWIEKNAARKQMSRSAYIERILEDRMDDDYAITEEELNRRSQEARTAIDKGTAKLYDNLDEFFKDLHEEVKQIHSVR